MFDPTYASNTDDQPKQLKYRRIVLQCGPQGLTSERTSFRTWMVCWPDPFNPHWTIIIWTFFSVAAFVGDVALDLSEAIKYFKSGDYAWMSTILFYILLPYLISIGYFMILKGRLWYEVYPTGMFYWSWKTVRSFLDIPSKDKAWTPQEASNYLMKLRRFLMYNRQRTQASDLDVYFGAIPQLILQSYIASQTALDTHVYEVDTTAWLSLCSSAIFVLRYEPSARHGQKGVIVDTETVLEPALYDYVAEIFFDFIYVVPRVVALGCFLTVKPSYVATICFFVIHLSVSYAWFYFSAPAADQEGVVEDRAAERDFRGCKRLRNDHFAHLQASIASLVFPPTHKAWPADFLDWKQRMRAVLTKQFCVVTAFQLCETSVCLGIWMAFASNRTPVVFISVPVIFWISLRGFLHVLYYAFLLFPVYTHEWECCYRRRGEIRTSEHGFTQVSAVLERKDLKSKNIENTTAKNGPRSE